MELEQVDVVDLEAFERVLAGADQVEARVAGAGETAAVGGEGQHPAVGEGSRPAPEGQAGGDVEEHHPILPLEGEASALDEDNPKAMAKFMRRLYESTGLKLGGGMEEAIRRMESGEDPDKIGEEMGDVLEEEDPFSQQSGKKNMVKKLRNKYQLKE